MDPIIPPQIWERYGPAGLLGTVFLMVMWGLLTPRWVTSRIERERDDWKALAFDLMRQNQDLLKGVSTSVDVLETIGRETPSPGRGTVKS